MKQFPKKYLLNGSDYFQVFLDRHDRRYGFIGNVSRLVLFLDGKIDVAKLEMRINSIPLLPWMHSLRLKTSAFFQYPRWQVKGAHPVAVGFHTPTYTSVTDCRALFERDINPGKDAPIQFDLVDVQGDHAVILSWNHILMDARGAEIILERIAQEFEINIFAADKFPEMSWKLRLKDIQRVKDFLIPSVSNGIRLFQPNKIKKKSTYRTICFSESDTKRIDENAANYKVGIAKSSFYLASVYAAFNEISHHSDKITWVPVPQDQRRKGQVGPIMSNQVSYLFYSMSGKQVDLAETIASLRDQMMNQMRERMPNSYHIMMDSIRRFPLWLYRHLVASPTKGALASFIYSDTGHSLEGMSNFLGQPIRNAIHYPPNAAFPGLTVIFMRMMNKQQIIYAFPDDEIYVMQMNVFEQKLKDTLLHAV